MTHARTIVIVTLGVVLSMLLARSAFAAEAEQRLINEKDIKWTTAPDGSKYAVLLGDARQAGPYVMRFISLPGDKVLPHWHSQDEYITVLSGTVHIGLGDKFDPSKAQALHAGGFYFLPGKTHHYMIIKTRSLMQVSGNGPIDITYVNPANDPKNAKR